MNVLEKVSRISICHEFMMVLHEHDQNINIVKRQLLLLWFFLSKGLESTATFYIAYMVNSVRSSSTIYPTISYDKK